MNLLITDQQKFVEDVTKAANEQVDVELSLDLGVLKSKQNEFETYLTELCNNKSAYLTLYNDNPFNEHFDDEPQRTNAEWPASSSEERKIILPIWLNFGLYVIMSVLSLGWLLRLIIFLKSVSANIFMKKVVLK